MTRLAIVLSLTALAAACGRTGGPASSPAPSAKAWAVVNGHEITRDDVEKAYRRAAPDNQQPSEEEAYTAKLNLLSEMIVQDILLTKAAQLKIEVPASELDNAYNEAKKNIPPAAFEEELKKRNLTAADMREDLRRNLLAQKVVEKEVGEKATPSEADIKAFFDANKAQFNRTEDAARIAQIVITPVREQQRSNRTGDDAGSPQEATAKAQMLMQRLKEGIAFGDLAADYSEDPESAQRGGDLGAGAGAAGAARRGARVEPRHGETGWPSRRVHDRSGRRQRQEGPEGFEHAGSERRHQLDAEESQGAAAARRLPVGAPQRRGRRQRAREADRRRWRQGRGHAEGASGSDAGRHTGARSKETVTYAKIGNDLSAGGKTPSCSPHSSIFNTAASSRSTV
jgi:parvulin-like peptidyl-prolyl isomerase